jgi:hypothetical protein
MSCCFEMAKGDQPRRARRDTSRPAKVGYLKEEEFLPLSYNYSIRGWGYPVGGVMRLAYAGLAHPAEDDYQSRADRGRS